MPSDPLSATLAALSDPTRRAILARLSEGEATVMELAEPFDMTLPAVSKHLKVLERAGLLTRGRDAQWRPCRLRPEGLKDASDWIERYRILWEGRLERMASYLEELKRAEERDLADGAKAAHGDGEPTTGPRGARPPTKRRPPHRRTDKEKPDASAQE